MLNNGYLSLVLWLSFLRGDVKHIISIGAAQSSLLSSFCARCPMSDQIRIAVCSLVAKEEDAAAMENRLRTFQTVLLV